MWRPLGRHININTARARPESCRKPSTNMMLWNFLGVFSAKALTSHLHHTYLLCTTCCVHVALLGCWFSGWWVVAIYSAVDKSTGRTPYYELTRGTLPYNYKSPR